tara:strand:- start:4009 stop:4536 length:528 start_codon:yes stop_codon:yes gene_type:complete
MIGNMNTSLLGQLYGGENFGNANSYMQSAQNDFSNSIPPINVGYYNAADNNPATYQQPTDPQQMDPMQYQQYMLQQYQQQMNPQQQMDPQQYQQQMQQQYQQYHQQMDPYEHQRYMQQQYQQQINPQEYAQQPQQANTGIAAQLQNEPVRFRNPDFYSDQQYLGFQGAGVRRQPR